MEDKDKIDDNFYDWWLTRCLHVRGNIKTDGPNPDLEYIKAICKESFDLGVECGLTYEVK